MSVPDSFVKIKDRRFKITLKIYSRTSLKPVNQDGLNKIYKMPMIYPNKFDELLIYFPFSPFWCCDEGGNKYKFYMSCQNSFVSSSSQNAFNQRQTNLQLQIISFVDVQKVTISTFVIHHEIMQEEGRKSLWFRPDTFQSEQPKPNRIQGKQS